MQGLSKWFFILTFLTFVLGVYTAFIRLETVYLNTERRNLKQKIEREKFEQRDLYLKLSELKNLEALENKANLLGLEYSY